MDKLTAIIIKEQMIGETSGHMAFIPNSPVLFSIYQVYQQNVSLPSGEDDSEFISFLKDLVQALEKG